MTIPSRTLIQLIQDVARSLGAYESGTATGGTTTTIVSATYPFKTGRSNASTKTYEGCEIRCTDATNTSVIDVREITAYAPSTGTFTVDTLSFTAANTDTFDIFKKGLRYADIKAAINRALRKRYYRYITPISLVNDADMESSGTTAWTAINSATLAKTSNDADDVFRGYQSLKITNTQADGGAKSNVIDVIPGVSYHVEALVRAETGTAVLAAYDSTNSALIESESWAYQGKGRIGFSFTTPATCEQIYISMSAAGASDVTHWDDVILYRPGATTLVLPDFITHPGQVLRVLGNYAREDKADNDMFTPIIWANIEPNQSSLLNQYKLTVPPIAYPVYIDTIRPWAELSTDASICYANRDWIELAATVELLDEIRNRAPGQETQAWTKLYLEKKRELRSLDYTHNSFISLDQGFSTAPNTPVWRY
jgi:hypothetical protein